MMSLQTIQNLQQEARKTAAKEGKKPYIVENEDIASWKAGRSLPIPFPNIGDYEPPGFTEEGEALFVDKSGFGVVGEPALTLEQMLDELIPGMGYAIVEEGQFQVYIQPFRRN